MAGVEEENRRRIAGVLCLVGVCLILIGVALALQDRGRIEARQNPLQQTSEDRNVLLAQAIREVLFWLLVLVGIFAVSTFAFLRWSRGFRARLFHRPHPPTSAEDVWTMHRVPDEPPADAQADREGHQP